ncbi:MAG: NAD(P)H-quinone oxidoreductase [Micavibrio sp.]|nr:NAD(P)H-quinone oxidoreductase [Micavibrio sp.]
MKAIEIQNQSLVPCERDIPAPKDGEILIKVVAAGVNRPDILQRQGLYPPPPGVTDIPGLEVSGIVETGHKRFQEGDEVCALLAGGGYAEYVCVPEEQCLPKPEILSHEQASVLPECIFTVWNNLVLRGGLEKDKGQNVLIHGGSSGIGTFAIQIAKAFGANVFTTAGSDEKCSACEELGATAINYKEQYFEEILSRTGLDIVLDMVGGSYTAKNINLMNLDGRIVNIAFLGGKKAEVNIQKIMAKRITLTGSTLRNRPIAEKAVLRSDIEENIWPLINKGIIKPIIDQNYPLKDAWKSHVRMESGKHIGKILLNVA